MTFPECKDCYTLGEVPLCDHRIKYMITECFIRDQDINGVKIGITDATAAPDSEYYEPPEKYWKAGKCDMIGGPHIRMWSEAYKMFGWDVLTSVLIHEFGHLKLYSAEGISKGVEAERKANSFGFCFMRNDLIPTHYWLHRELFLPSHIDPNGWTEARFRDEYEKWTMWMKDAPTVRALATRQAG